MRIGQLITRTIIMGASFGVLTVTPLSAAPPVKPASDLQCTGCVGSTDISSDAVTGDQVLDESLTADDIKHLIISPSSDNNTAIGREALNPITTGIENTASGFGALFSNTIGHSNTASGVGALRNNTDGNSNTASGKNALGTNTTGFENTASGANALVSNTTGHSNTAIGTGAGSAVTTGHSNTAIGTGAGSAATTGDNNIYVNNSGVAAESNTIRIGQAGLQTVTYIAGINAAGPIEGATVLIDGSGRLGTTTSSRRFKDEIREMGEASSDLLQLRPVTFRYKQPYANGARPVDYGLIAEEVAEVYPALVTQNTDGQIESVQYHKLVPMLLNELQKQHRLIEILTARLARLEALAERESGLVTAQTE